MATKMETSIVTGKPKAPALYYDDLGGALLTGGDQRIAHQPEIVSWLARVYAEKEKGSRPWPQFDARRLKSFLVAVGVDTEAAVKDHKDAAGTVPAPLTEHETCIPALKGASFLATTSEGACVSIRKQYQASARG